MRLDTVIIDNFLENPDVVRKQALSLDFYQEGSFPGKRSDRPEKDYEEYVKQKIESLVNLKIKEWSLDSFRFQICLEGDDTWCHVDPSPWAGILYLSPDAPLESGTGIYRENDNNEQKLVTGVGNVYNRLVIYRGDLLHRSIVPGFGNTKETGRLTQVFFFKTEDDDE